MSGATNDPKFDILTEIHWVARTFADLALDITLLFLPIKSPFDSQQLFFVSPTI
jgi:hypothetical protein